MTDKKELAELFMLRFAGLERAYGKYILEGEQQNGGKVQGRATTVAQDVHVGLWQKHLAGQQGLGIVPIRDDGTCWFGAIDIDDYTSDIKEIEEACARLNLPLLPTNTKSGGCHLYLFGSEPLRADLVRRQLAQWSIAIGFSGVEIFPKQERLASTRDVGNWINMPYYGGTRRGIFKGAELNEEEYLARASVLAVTNELLEALSVPETDGIEEGPPCLQALSKRGFPKGTRNNAMFNIGVYVRKRFPDEWENKLLQYNDQFMSPPLDFQEVETIVKSLRKKTYNYTCDQPPIMQSCNRGVCIKRRFGIGGEQEWNVTLDNDALKICSDPPYWIIGVDGRRMEVSSSDMMMQDRFRKLCVETIDKIPTRLKNNEWEKKVQWILENAKHVDAPQDASRLGIIMFHLEQFCTGSNQAESREELLTGRPFTEDGATYFRSGDFMRFLDQQHIRGMTSKELYMLLRRAGVKHHSWNIKGKCVQCWSVDEFKTTDEQLPARHVEMGAHY